MATKARAAILVEQGQPLVIDDVLIDDPGPGEVLVKVEAAGLCHSDYHYMEGSLPVATPALLGHEAAGVVMKLGLGVTQLEEGDHVIPLFSPQCGRCSYCMSGRTNQCELTLNWEWPLGRVIWRNRKLHNWVFGGFASHLIVPEVAAARIRKDAPLDRAFYAGCGVTTGVASAVIDARVRPGSSVIVFGLGGIGLNVLQGARLAGAARIIGIDINPEREQLARKFGMTDFVNPRNFRDDIVGHLQKMTGGGADYTFEAIGNSAVIKQAIDTAHPSWGSVIVIGVTPMGEMIATAGSDYLRGRTLKGTWFGGAHGRRDVPTIIDWYMQGKILIDELVTHRIGLERINEGFEMLVKGESIRTVITQF